MNYHALLDAVQPLRASLPPNLAAALARTAELNELKPGQRLLQLQLGAPRVAFLANGFAAYSIGGGRVAVDIVPSGAWIALSFCLNPGEMPPSVWAVSHATVVTFPREDLLRAAYASPQLALTLALDAADDARTAFSHLTVLRARSAEGRCAYVLVDISERIYGSTSFECALDQSALASLAGLSRGAFSRALKHLTAQRLLSCERNQYRLLDVEALKGVQ